MVYYIDIQKASHESLPLNDNDLNNLVSLALRDYKKDAEVTLRMVTPEEITYLNNTYRKKNKATNVLAFPSSLPPQIQLEVPFLGDVVLCPQILLSESKKLNKTLESHWALIVIHGILHLLGYDHTNNKDTIEMQSIEIKLLAELGFANPYIAEGNELE